MKKKNGYTAIDLLVVIVTISKVSYALSDDKSELYNLEIKLIETQAQAYGNTKKEEIKGKSTTVTINHLINEKYLEADDKSGNIYDPRDKTETLNNKKVKLTYDKATDSIKAKLQD